MDEPTSVTGLLLLARALYLGCGMVLVNAIVFRWLILAPRFEAGLVEASWRIRGRLRVTFLVTAFLLAVAAVLWFWAVAAGMSGTSLRGALDRPTWSTVFFETRFGLVSQVRLGFFALLAVMACPFCCAERLPKPWRRVIEACTSFVAAALLSSVAWTGHAGAEGGRAFPWTLLADSIHLLAGSIWPAGLLFFAWILTWGVARENPIPFALLITIARRFAVVSLAAVVVIALTGSVETWLIVRTVNALITTNYGRLLCVKLTVFAAMLTLASWNRFRLLPCLETLETDRDTIRQVQILLQLRRFVRMELALAAGILAIVALLGTLPPPH